MRIGYADPPYPGMSYYYRDHPDFGGEVDHGALIEVLEQDFDGWALHTASTTLAQVLAVCPSDTRVGAWVKPFASFKKNVTTAYAWEPVLFKGWRRRPMTQPTVRDGIAEPITLRRGLTGAKPEAVCWWVFEILGMTPDDELCDLFPGSGAVQRAWDSWQSQGSLLAERNVL